jgi:hypothetical protein
VSAGSTGAAMASAAILIGRVPGVLRPTIATVLPTRGTATIMVDSGANPEVKPEHLVQFGEMGAALAEIGLGIRHPRVALLNIGEEKGKGRPLEKAAYEMLSAANVDFVGNVEGRDIAGDKADVIVTDGFTGNVFLKTIEGAGGLVMSLLDEALDRIRRDEGGSDGIDRTDRPPHGLRGDGWSLSPRSRWCGRHRPRIIGSPCDRQRARHGPRGCRRGTRVPRRVQGHSLTR